MKANPGALKIAMARACMNTEDLVKAAEMPRPIKAHMGDSEELRAGEYKITWKPVTSTRVDTGALKAAAPELVERFTKATTTRRFCVA